MRGMFITILISFLVALNSYAADAATCAAKANGLAVEYLRKSATDSERERSLGFRVNGTDAIVPLGFYADNSPSRSADFESGVDKLNYVAEFAVHFDRRRTPATNSAPPAKDIKVKFFYSGSSTCQDLLIVRVLALGGV